MAIRPPDERAQQVAIGEEPEVDGARLVLRREEVRGKPAWQVGSKAARLAELPAEWVPDFVVLPEAFVLARQRAGDARTVLDGLRGADAEALELVISHMHASTLSENASVFIRSNAADEEETTEHGKYDSISVGGELGVVADAIDSLLQDASPKMRLILQVGIDGVVGRISNERRVSARPSEALVEGLQGERRQYVRRASKAGSAPLVPATNGASIKRALGALTRWIDDSGYEEFSAEWVGDGQRVWIVQWQPVVAKNPRPWVTSYLQGTDPLVQALDSNEGLSFWTPMSGEVAPRWPKLSKAALFVRLGIPTPNILVFEGRHWAEAAAAGAGAELVSLMPGVPWVIRTDVAEEVTTAKELLPTSAPLRDLQALSDFIRNTVAVLTASGFPRNDWALLAAPVVAARASAMAYGVPGSPSTQVDALWGFPDGLLYLPHDRSLVPSDDHVEVTSEVNYKPACLLFEGLNWTYAELVKPWDYQRVLDDEELRLAARWAKAVSGDVGAEVQLMVLCRIGGGSGPEAMMAFHYSTESIRRPSERPTDIDDKNVLTISEPNDLERALLNGPAGHSALRLRPNRPLRDTAFLVRLANTAIRWNKPILFDGSLLGHAYHILSSTGASVFPAVVSEMFGPPTTYSKLVRDLIPAIVEQSGSVARVRPLSPEEADQVLRQKLIEEALEVFAAAGENSVLSELADVSQVLVTLAGLYDGGIHEVERLREEKLRQRGGFDDLIFLEFTRPTLIDLALERGLLPVNLADAKITDQVRPTIEIDGSQLSVEVKLPLVPSRGLTELAATPLPDGRVARVSIRYDSPDAIVVVQIAEDDGTGGPSQQTLFDA